MEKKLQKFAFYWSWMYEVVVEVLTEQRICLLCAI